MLLKKAVLLVFALSTVALFADEDYVEQAWQALGTNRFEHAEKLLLAAIEKDGTDKRARVTLSYLYQLQGKNRDAWEHFSKIIDFEQSFEPYIFAGDLTAKVTFNYEHGVIDLYKKIIDIKSANPVLRASLCERVGKYLQTHNQLEEAEKFFARVHPIRQWTLIGPFDNISGSGFRKNFPPELEFATDKSYEGKSGIQVKWFEVKTLRRDNWIDHKHYFAYNNAVFYGNTFVHSPHKRVVHLRVGTSGSLQAFLNDELMLESEDENNNDLDTYIARTELQRGWNRILIKTGYSEISQCNFMVRLTDENGLPLSDIKVSAEKQDYAAKPGAPCKILPNFAEAWFEQKIAENPDHLENYLLLSDCYLRNDKATEAELVLRKARERAPDNALIINQFIEAFIRGEKYDEKNTTMQQLSDLVPDIPSVLEYRFNNALENLDYESCEKIMGRYEQQFPGSEKLFTMRVQYYSKKKMSDKIIALTDQAFRAYPKNWDFAAAQAILSTFTTKKFDQAIQILSDFVMHTTSVEALATLAEFHLKASDLKSWQRTYDKLLTFYPSSTGYYHKMSKTYFALQDYDNAKKYIMDAINLCSNSALYWSDLAEIYRAVGKPSDAIAAYKTALNFSPTYYDARDKLRDLQKKPPVFSYFDKIAMDSLMRSAPAAADYPNDGAVILLSDAQRVVYDRGVSEAKEKLLVKVFNNDGIQSFQEYWIDYNANSEELILERAVVRKQDGTEVKADQDGGHLVFKSLEPGDFIVIEWRLRSYYAGRLAKHFWDERSFNGYYPMKQVRYGLLVPEGTRFQTRGQNMPDAASVRRKTPDGDLYQWTLHDEPAVVYEYYMPGLEDVGKRLYVTSIENWEYLVDWYLNLAQTKARSTFEIRELVENLFAGKENASEEEKIKTVYDYVTDNINYSSVSFRQSGLVPQKARNVCVTKIGDCKDMAALAIAMFEELDINAHYVLVNTRDEGLNRNALPSIAFNHAIVGVESPGGTRYLDMTAQNYPLGSVPSGDLGAFALEIKPGSSTPVYLRDDSFMKRTIIRTGTVRIQDDLSLVIAKESIRRGSTSAWMRDAYRFKGEKERLQSFAEGIAETYPNATVTKLDFDNLNELSPDLTYRFEYIVPEYINDAGGFLILQLPWADNLEPSKALSYESRLYPYNYWPYADTLSETLRIELPAGSEPLDLGSPITYSSSVADYTLELRFEDGAIIAKRHLVNKKATVEPEAYQEFKTFYNNVVKADRKQILIRKGEMTAK